MRAIQMPLRRVDPWLYVPGLAACTRAVGRTADGDLIESAIVSVLREGGTRVDGVLLSDTELGVAVKVGRGRLAQRSQVE